MRQASIKPPSSILHLGLAGCGKMGSAMATAWMQSFHVAHIDIFDPSGLPGDLPGNGKITGFTDQKEFLARASDFNVLVMAVKPQIMDAACASIAPHLKPDTIILSIAAGKNLAYLQEKFGKDRPIVRAMPNTPASVGKAITVACASSSLTETQKNNITFLLACLGKVAWIEDETIMNAVTAVSGSGPAYVFYLIETLAQAGIEAGLEKDFAMTLARQTVIGAAALAEDQAEIDASTLRENVTSPGGTTAAALSTLMDGRLQQIMTDAVAKATARGKELSK